MFVTWAIDYACERMLFCLRPRHCALVRRQQWIAASATRSLRSRARAQRQSSVTRAQLPLLEPGNYELCGSLTLGPALWIGSTRRVIVLKHKRRPCCPPHAPVYWVARALFRSLRLVVPASINLRAPPARLVRFAARTIFVRRHCWRLVHEGNMQVRATQARNLLSSSLQ